MKKTLLSITLLALMSLTAQASDVEQMEATVSQIMEDAVQASSEQQAGEEKAPSAEKNDTQEEEKAPSTESE